MQGFQGQPLPAAPAQGPSWAELPWNILGQKPAPWSTQKLTLLTPNNAALTKHRSKRFVHHYKADCNDNFILWVPQKDSQQLLCHSSVAELTLEYPPDIKTSCCRRGFNSPQCQQKHLISPWAVFTRPEQEPANKEGFPHLLLTRHTGGLTCKSNVQHELQALKRSSKKANQQITNCTLSEL